MNKEIVVLGDIEIGAGNITDDFISDNTLSKLILNLSKKKHAIDLILNGDTFDFMKCPYQLKPEEKFTRYISKDISIAKLRLMHNAHTKVFDALKIFVKGKNKNLYFTIGNHDHDLVFTELQHEIKRILKSESKVHFPGIRYQNYGVNVEHGHQYDQVNKIPRKLFKKHKGKILLNYPFLTFTVMSILVDLKFEHPFSERIKPLDIFFTYNNQILRKINKIASKYFVKSLFYYPIRYFYDPTHRFPIGLTKEFIRRLSRGNWEVDKIHKKFKTNRKCNSQIYVFGHIHEKIIDRTPDYTIIHPDCWRDEYLIRGGSKLVPKTKYYVSIKINNDVVNSWDLVPVKIKRKNLNLNRVIRNEHKFIDLVAKEEGFKGNYNTALSSQANVNLSENTS